MPVNVVKTGGCGLGRRQALLLRCRLAASGCGYSRFSVVFGLVVSNQAAKTRSTKLLLALCLATWVAGGEARAQDQANAPAAQISRLANTDLPGSDFSRLSSVTLQACSAACVAEAQCKAFTYNISARVCFLKNQVPEQKSFQGATSGIKQQAAAADAPQVADDTPPAKSLIEDWRQANERCGATANGAAEAAAWCEVRTALAVVLQLQDWCNGKEGQPPADHAWHECDVTSLKVEIPKSVSTPGKYERSDAPVVVTSPQPQSAPAQPGPAPAGAEQPKPAAAGEVAPAGTGSPKPKGAEAPAQAPSASGQPAPDSASQAGGTPKPPGQPAANEPAGTPPGAINGGGAPKDAGAQPAAPGPDAEPEAAP